MDTSSGDAPEVPAALRAELAESRRLGFLGPGEIEPHIDHALDFAAIVDHLHPARALDMGSGGGLPGLVLAAVLPHVAWALLDANTRRTAFLGTAAARLDVRLPVRVLTGRAELLGRDDQCRSAFDLVVARSFGSPAVTAECAAPLLRIDGHLLVSEPPMVDAGDRWPGAPLRQLGLERIDLPDTDRPLTHRFVLLRQVEPCSDRFPRRVGVPSKRPLFVSRET